MKKRNTRSIKPHVVRGAFYVACLIFILLTKSGVGQQNVLGATAAVTTMAAETPFPTATATPTATPTATETPTPCDQYWAAAGTLPIVPGTTDTGNHCDDCDTAVTLPFPFRLYGVTYTSVMVSSNGRLDFLCNNEPEFGSFCLPAGDHNCPYAYTIFPLWTTLRTDTDQVGCSTWANGCGIFTSISGTAPNRIFNIEWHALLDFTSNTPQDFEVRLYENDPNQRFDVIYGLDGSYGYGGDYLWVGGVQGQPGFYTQDFCHAFYPPPTNVSRTYTFVPCASPTPTPTATATATALPRQTPTPKARPTPQPRPTP